MIGLLRLLQVPIREHGFMEAESAFIVYGQV